MNNVERHAAKNLKFGAKTTDAICYMVVDDGIGFDAAAKPAEGRFGLVGMDERARLIDAELEIVSSVGKGTTVKLSLPLNGGS